MKRGTSIRALGAVILLSSCGGGSQGPVCPGAYIAYAEDPDHGLRKTIEVGEWVYDIQYKPAAYVALRESGPRVTSAALQMRVRELKHTVWFNIKMRTATGTSNPLKQGATGLGDYQDKLGYYLTGAASDLRLLYGDQEVSQIVYHFENNYGLTPDDAMVVGFRIPDSAAVKPLKLEYHDQVNGTGIVRLTIDPSDLSAIPSIAI